MSQEIFPVGTSVLAMNLSKFKHGLVTDILDVSKYGSPDSYHIQKYLVTWCDGNRDRFSFEEIINLNENYVRTWKPKSSQ